MILGKGRDGTRPGWREQSGGSEKATVVRKYTAHAQQRTQGSGSNVTTEFKKENNALKPGSDNISDQVHTGAASCVNFKIHGLDVRLFPPLKTALYRDASSRNSGVHG